MENDYGQMSALKLMMDPPGGRPWSKSVFKVVSKPRFCDDDEGSNGQELDL